MPGRLVAAFGVSAASGSAPLGRARSRNPDSHDPVAIREEQAPVRIRIARTRRRVRPAWRAVTGSGCPGAWGIALPRHAGPQSASVTGHFHPSGVRPDIYKY